jgi:hypothetical protein
LIDATTTQTQHTPNNQNMKNLPNGPSDVLTQPIDLSTHPPTYQSIRMFMNVTTTYNLQTKLQTKHQTTKQPNNQTTKQPNDQPTKQPNNQTTKQPNNQTTKQTKHQNMKNLLDGPSDVMTQPIDLSTHPPIHLSTCLPI